MLANWLNPYRIELLPDFPFGTDFDAIEKVLLPALSHLGEAAGSKRRLAAMIWASLTLSAHPQEAAAMQRMGYTEATRLSDRLQARALRGALRVKAREQEDYAKGRKSKK
jgi:hypothetical protein